MALKNKKKLGFVAEGDGAIGEAAPTANPEASTAEPEVKAVPQPKAKQTPLSPYTSNPITINVGPVPVTYYVPRHLLKCTNWSTVPAGGEISLPTMSADTGHVLVHYLYTGKYQTLESVVSDIAQQPELALKQALLVYMASVTLALNGLEQLAKKEIEDHSASMDLKTILDITRSEMPKKTEPSGWIQAYLKDKTQKAFEKDHTVFADDAFCAILCKHSKLNDHVMRSVVKLLSEKLTQVLAGKEDITHALDEVPRSQPVSEEEVGGKDLFAGLSKLQRKKLERKVEQMKKKEKARLEAIEAAAAALSQGGVINDQRLALDIVEESAAIEEPVTRWEASAPAPEPQTCYESSVPTLEAETHHENSMNFVGPEENRPTAEPPKSVWVEYVPPPPPKNETISARKNRLRQEKKDKEKWDREQQERIDQEEKEKPCVGPVSTTHACWEDSGLTAESDSSWEPAVPSSPLC
ncbi:uncharacterized protein CC84DRAFT_1253942 [Paraphaeosphaeria sporulosa]|uniref:BTB domain-containing protein n=1 Tax=Paraphaeosphaeria sporulosa TaxID=1460663 RepID=A0A177CW75_9PLEO|nr:uncharacterized protein CC84DRAFT_1253942 [Paraphaeosphaeria sporulosa]OAG11486.1 hypothetical protein CC84DRAFT_1253942 [Paraphaeosphaeria sporulosa]